MARVGTDPLLSEEDQNKLNLKYTAYTQVTITIAKSGKSRQLNDLIYHDGYVNFGSDRRVMSSVICFKPGDNVAADRLFADLSLVGSPYIVTPFAYGRGVGEFDGHSFLAVPHFDCTLIPYINAQSRVTIDKQRLTEEFIGIVRNMVDGILTLHGKGFCCRYLKPHHVLIFTVGSLKTGKIWNFCPAANEDVKSEDWSRLGSVIKRAADAQLISTIEIIDLCKRLQDGSLKGVQILKHSALLTVQEKFENILALNFYIEVHKKHKFQLASEDPQAVDHLKAFIAANQNWKGKIPAWIVTTVGYKNSSDDTGGGFVLWLRDRVEHCFSFVPSKVQRQRISQTQIFGTDPDLECVLRQTWAELYLEVQNLVAELNIHY